MLPPIVRGLRYLIGKVPRAAESAFGARERSLLFVAARWRLLAGMERRSRRGRARQLPWHNGLSDADSFSVKDTSVKHYLASHFQCVQVIVPSLKQPRNSTASSRGSCLVRPSAPLSLRCVQRLWPEDLVFCRRDTDRGSSSSAATDTHGGTCHRTVLPTECGVDCIKLP